MPRPEGSGRPNRHMHQTSVYYPTALIAVVDARARIAGVSRAEYLRRLITLALNITSAQETPNDQD